MMALFTINGIEYIVRQRWHSHGNMVTLKCHGTLSTWPQPCMYAYACMFAGVAATQHPAMVMGALPGGVTLAARRGSRPHRFVHGSGLRMGQVYAWVPVLALRLCLCLLWCSVRSSLPWVPRAKSD